VSTLEELKKYLVGNSGYLLNDDNNGKTVMLSGAWGSGKTHFWQNDIEPKLSEKLKEDNKACVYVSLYGKDNIEVIKSEILQKAYSEIKEENIKQTKAISAFGMGTKILAGISIFGVKVDAQDISDGTKNHYDMKKIEDATEFLSDGGLICFDDFERKSKKIDLNDLFGFISQLAIDMKCKVVIILNSDVFEGEEANVFKTVKEKTVNKFFYFEPTIEELFDSIYSSNKRYKKLDDYKDEILNSINETEELNARIYIQVLDNCLEWITKGYDGDVLRTLVLNTVCFVQYHFILSYPVYLNVRVPNSDKVNDGVAYNEFRSSSEISWYIVGNFLRKDLEEKIFIQNKIDSFYDDIVGYIGSKKISTEEKQIMLDEVEKFYDDYLVMIRFGYKIYVAKDIEKNLYKQVSKFIETGILVPRKDSL